MRVLYMCCEHCAEDPAYHDDYGPDDHETWCSIPGCIAGKMVNDEQDRD